MPLSIPHRIRRGAWIIPLLCACAIASSQSEPTPPHRDAATTRHSFEDVEHWVKVFDDPARDGWQKPAEVVQALKIRPGRRVADLGAGTGYLMRHLSAAVGDTGAVFALYDGQFED